MAMLSPFIHLLQQRSFRRSGTETCAGRSATPRKLSSLAAHLFDARRTLPPHSCQVPQCWAVGRTNGMKRSFFGAVAAPEAETEHSKRRLFEVWRSTVHEPWGRRAARSANLLLFLRGRVLCDTPRGPTLSEVRALVGEGLRDIPPQRAFYFYFLKNASPA